MMSIQNIVAELLASLVLKRIENEAHGIILMDLPSYSYKTFLETLYAKVEEKTFLAPYVFFVGFTSDEKKELRDSIGQNFNYNIFYSEEDAEQYRHNKELMATRIVIVKRLVPKLSSLFWFERINVRELYNLLCDLAQEEFKTVNQNIVKLWKAIKHNSVRNIISLERLVDYYQYLIQVSEDIPKQSVYQFYRLGLLIDENLFENTNLESIRRKLIENHKTVQRLRQLDKGDQKALQSSEIEEARKVRANILNFYKTRSNESLKDLTLNEVIKILTKVNKQKKSNNKKDSLQGENNKSNSKKNKPTSPDSVGVDLIIEHDEDQIKNILEKIDEEYKGWEKGKKEVISIEGEDSISKVEFIPEVYNLIETFVGENTFGGIIKAEEKTPLDVLNSINKNSIQQFDRAYAEQIIEILRQFREEFSEAIILLDLFNEYLAKRNKISSYAPRLSDSPVLKVAESEETFNNLVDYIEIYTKFIKELRSYYNKFSTFSASGTKELIARINSLDIVYVIGGDKYHAVLSPLNPLYLWKFVELTRRLKETSSDLSEIDKELLVRASDDIPNPLITVFISSFISNNRDEVIPEVGKLGKLPIYSNEQQVNQISDGLSSVKRALDKFINIYPHSKYGLRIAFINPPDVKSILDILKDNINDNTLKGVHIEFFKTRETSQNWSNLEQVDEGLLTLFGDNNNYSLKIHTKKYEYGSLVNKLKSKQFHSIVIFDPSKRTVSEKKIDYRLNLSIHPLCIPKIFDYDPITDRLEIIPSSEGNIFSDHHELIARLNDRPRGWFNTVISDTESIKAYLKEMINKTEWLIIADPNLKNFEITTIGSENCIYYQSGSYRDVGVYSQNWSKLINGIDNIIRTIGNYDPKPQCLEMVLREIQSLNEKGILNIASLSTNQTFDQNHSKGALGTAISSIWYKRNNNDCILASLDTDLARRWLSEREENSISDLIGIKKISENQAEIDIIEVKTYKAYTIDNSEFEDGTQINEIKGEAVEQLHSVNKIIREIFFEQDKLTSVSRRELLRFQVFKVLHNMGLKKSQKRAWTTFLNDLFAGNIQIKINLNIFHVCFNVQGETDKKGIKCVSEHDIALFEIKDDVINGILAKCSNCEEVNSNTNSEENKIIIGNKQKNINEDPLQISRLRTDEVKNDLSEDIQNEKEDVIKQEQHQQSDQNSEYIQHQLAKKLTFNSKESKEDNVHANEANSVNGENTIDKELMSFIEKTANALYRAMKDYSIDVLEVDPSKALIASRFVRFRVRLRPGETLQKLLRVRSDIAREIEATSEILIDNERGTNFIYVDVPREKTDTVSLLDYLNLLPNNAAVGNLNVILGQDPSGEIEIMNIAKAPHLLTAGSTGSGKTIFLYSIIVSLISQYNEDELELVIIDPKQTDFIYFEGLPHLRNNEVIIEAEDAVQVLNDLVENELQRRTNLLRQSRNRDIFTYNANNPENPLKPILVIIDEYADLVQVADLEGSKADFERNMIRLAQRSRNVGIHLVIATQRPSADIVTSRLKANIPTRVSFSLPANQDSRTILDAPGAEDLLGKGDMLYSVNGELRRLQGLFISEDELEEFLSEKYGL